MDKQDYYEILGVKKDSSKDEIKKAFRKLSRQFHPDMQHGKSEEEKKHAEEQFKKIAEAYDVLSDDVKRQQYDNFGFSNQKGFGGQGVDLGEFFQRHADIFSDFFTTDNFGFNSSNFNHFNFGWNNKNTDNNNYDCPENGRNVQVKMNLSLKECIFGTTKEFDISINKTCSECNGSGHEKDSKKEKCPQCHGTGQITEIRRNGFMVMQESFPCNKCNGRGTFDSSPCKKCSGKGRILEKEHIVQKIDPGISSGRTIIIKDKGEGGRNGGKNGNLQIIPMVDDHDEFFSRKNPFSLDLQTISYISPLIPLFGGKTNVITPYGLKEISIPVNVTNGSVVKLEKQGIKTDHETGDLYVKLIFDNLAYLSNDDIRKLRDIHDHVGLTNLKNQKDLTDKFKTSWL